MQARDLVHSSPVLAYNPALVETTIVRAYPEALIERRWRQFLRRSSLASHFVSPEYFIDPRIQGKKPFAILAGRTEQVEGCLTAWHEGSRVISGFAAHPQLLVLDSSERHLVEAALVNALLKEAKDASLVTVFSWSKVRAFEDMNFWVRENNATFVLDLSLPEERLFRNLDGKRRNGIRSAMKGGIEVREAGAGDLTKFHEVLKATHERLGLEAPLSIEIILRPETNRKLLVAFYQGACIAGTIVRYESSGLAEYSENASLPEFWRLHPNDLLLWEAARWAKRIGCTAMNLGGHNLFKKQFGGTLVPIFQMSQDFSWCRWRHARERIETLGRRLYRTAKNEMQILKRIGAASKIRLGSRDEVRVQLPASNHHPMM